MNERSPIIVWIRRDLRLTDHGALHAAASTGRPVIPVFVRDAGVDGLGAAPKWRLGQGLACFAAALEAIGSRLILRSGAPLEVLRALAAETGASAVHWQRAHDRAGIERDTGVKAGLEGQGIAATSHRGHLLFEPWSVATKQGGAFRVFTPFWRAVKDRPVPAPLPRVARLPAPALWPQSEPLDAWRLGAAMMRGAAVVARHAPVGEQAALDRLAWFTANAIDRYAERRDFPAEDATSRLSAHLSLGEIGPRMVWHAGLAALERGARGAEQFLKELAWREFAWHLLYHTPHIAHANWRPEWDAFPWSEDAAAPQVLAWKQGRTGLDFVDAAMREMYVTGTMHNRARMIAASTLTKHLMTHWRVGLRWFEQCLVDWDPASNAMGWQWVAGSGPDAAPYFRIFNPETQRERFDPDGAYLRRWIAEGQAEGQAEPPQTALDFFEAIPRSWGLSPRAPRPSRPVVTPAEGRRRALAAYQNR